VAQAAGVNVSTVSRALRGVRGVSPAEAERIRAIARRLGYRPNPFIAAFNAQVRSYRCAPTTATIALLDCWPAARPSWASFDDSVDYIGGINRRADHDVSPERLQRLLRTRRIYGLLVLPVPENTDLSALDFSQLACATIDFSLQRPLGMRRASANYYHNMWLALTTLGSRGYRRIGYVMTRLSSQRQDNLSLAAFLAFRLSHPHTCVAPYLSEGRDYRTKLAKWMDRDRPDAVVTNDLVLPDDIVAVGRRMPQDVAGVLMARQTNQMPGVTYIDEDYQEVGAQAVDMIVDAIHRNEFGLPRTLIVHFVDGFWQEGSTVRPAPTVRPT